MDRPEVETWRNSAAGYVVVWKLDLRGQWKDELVSPGAKVALSRDDRIYNMDLAASKDLDVFQNGTLVPVRLLDGNEDAHEFASNPNMIGEAEMRELFKAHWKHFDAKVQEISNLGTLERMRALAESDDVEATLRQVQALEARIKGLSPFVTEITSTPIDRVGFGEKPVSPSGRTL
jgi:hypothetical protein